MINRTKSSHSDKLKLTTLILLIVSLIGFSACSDLNLDGSEGEGTMNFYMSNSSVSAQTAQQNAPQNAEEDSEDMTPSGNHDEPLNLQEVNIEILQLDVRFSTVQIDTVNADSIVAEEGNTKWVSIPIEPEKVNLLDIEDIEILLAEAELTEGYYSEIRLILGDDNDVVDEDGETHSLTTPSGQQSGYKIKLDKHLHSGETFDLTIDFDAEHSIRVTGNNRYMLHPVLNTRQGKGNS